MAKHVLGFDCSSKAVHMVQLDMSTGDIVRMEKWTNPSRDMEQRFNLVMDDFEEWFNKWSAKKKFLAAEYVSVIENPIYVNNIKATVGITNVIAGVKRHLWKSGIDYWARDNRVWKKLVLGSGAANKEEIMNWAKSKWGDKFPEQDWADAACIAMYRIMFEKL